MVKASNEEEIADHNKRAWLAWHTAVLGRAKKVPELSKLMKTDNSEKQLQNKIKGVLKSSLPIKKRVK